MGYISIKCLRKGAKNWLVLGRAFQSQGARHIQMTILMTYLPPLGSQIVTWVTYIKSPWQLDGPEIEALDIVIISFVLHPDDRFVNEAYEGGIT